MFKKGTKMYWKNSNLPAFEKLGDNEFDWWVSLDSKYLVEKINPLTNEKEYEQKLETEKPLYNKEGRLNRFGFKWTDQQVFDYYRNIMNFKD
jgi:hypothetical protein